MTLPEIPFTSSELKLEQSQKQVFYYTLFFPAKKGGIDKKTRQPILPRTGEKASSFLGLKRKRYKQYCLPLCGFSLGDPDKCLLTPGNASKHSKETTPSKFSDSELIGVTHGIKSDRVHKAHPCLRNISGSSFSPNMWKALPPLLPWGRGSCMSLTISL